MAGATATIGAAVDTAAAASPMSAVQPSILSVQPLVLRRVLPSVDSAQLLLSGRRLAGLATPGIGRLSPDDGN